MHTNKKKTDHISEKRSENPMTDGLSQELLSAIVTTSDDTIISKTLKGIITSWNKAAERMFGYAAEEAIGQHISLIIPPERIDEETYIISNISAGRKIDHFETVRVAKDGHLVSISLSVSPILNSKGMVVGASKIARDITEQRRLEERQARLAAIVDSSDDTIISKNLKGIITSWNKAAERMFGYSEAEAIGQHISFIIPPERLAEEDYIISNVSAGNKIDHFETIRVTKDGHRIPISLSVSPIMDTKGNIIGASKIARDISAQKAAQQATERYTRNLETLQFITRLISTELSIDTILKKVVTASAQLTAAEFGLFWYGFDANRDDRPASFALFGISAEEFKVSPEFSQLLRGVNKQALEPIELHKLFNSRIWLPVYSKENSVIGGLMLGRKETGKFGKEELELIGAVMAQATVGLENARLYEEIRSINDKKDEFIGFESHELRTPLTSMIGYLQLLERWHKDDKEHQFVAKTVQQVKKLSALVSDLLDVSKIEAGKLKFNHIPFDLQTTIEDTVELMRLSHTRFMINLHTGKEKLMVTGDEHRIEQVLLNLIANAIKYSPQGNQIEIYVQSSARDVKVGVRDYGIGIPAKKLAKIFDRFYRAEEQNPTISGLGIGLYICREIIQRHKGKIWCESESGKGSTFWFSLPLSFSEPVLTLFSETESHA